MDADIITKNNCLKKLFLSSVDEMVILPLKKWKIIEGNLEDLEMYRSAGFAKEIAARRKETKTVSLRDILKKYKIK